MLDWILDIARKLNYRYELISITKSTGGVRYSSYDLRPPPDETLRTLLMDRIAPGDVVYDIGAYYGSYTLPAAALGGNVVAFEPNPHSVARLRKNAEATRPVDGSIDIRTHGVESEDDQKPFYQSSSPAFSSFDSDHISRHGHQITGETTIKVRSIDSLVETGALKPPDHIKIDVEGLSLAVLSGAVDTLTETTPLIYLEPHDVGGGDYRGEALANFFQKHNYQYEVHGYPWLCEPADEP